MAYQAQSGNIDLETTKAGYRNQCELLTGQVGVLRLPTSGSCSLLHRPRGRKIVVPSIRPLHLLSHSSETKQHTPREEGVSSLKRGVLHLSTRCS